MDKIEENFNELLSRKYTKELRELTIQEKLTIIINFIEREVKTLKYKKQTTNQKYFNMQEWLKVVKSLDVNYLESIETTEKIFLSSVIDTPGFRTYAINYKRLNYERINN